ncbi:MAG: CHC2 zinc finger domain-containing protein [Candidatus Hydrogenedentales bacterium]|jgi:DNA primase
MSRRIDAERLKAGVPPMDFYRVELPGMPPPKRDSGWQPAGLCPFHPDKRAGNFRVNLDSGAYKCFACGASGGDIIAFTERRYGLTFLEAVAALADVWRCRA